MCRCHVCGCPQRPEDGFGSPRTGVRGTCEPPDVTELRVGVQVRSISDLCSCVFNNRDVLLTSGKQPRALATKGLDTQGPRQYPSLFWRLGLSLVWSSQVTWAGWSANPSNPPFCLPWAGITRVTWHLSWPFPMGSGTHTHACTASTSSSFKQFAQPLKPLVLYRHLHYTTSLSSS